MGLDQDLLISDKLLNSEGIYYHEKFNCIVIPTLDRIAYYRKNYHLQDLVLKIHPKMLHYSNQQYLPLTQDDVNYIHQMGGINDDVVEKATKAISEGKYLYYYSFF